MSLLILSMIILAASGLLSLCLGRNPGRANAAGAGGAILGCLLGLVPAARVVASGKAELFSRPWDVPYGSFTLRLDALSAFFLIPVFFLCAVAALYGWGYLKAWYHRKNLGASWFFFNLLAASMALVVSAANAVLFLVAWEVMSMASFFLVTFEDEREEVRKAGWIYLAATHLGTAFLLILFLVLGKQAGTLDFNGFSASASIAGPAFLLALVGFGTKAGFMPLHVWLPEAHPAAPSHVSAVMSGVMIKTGIYGLVRTLTFLTPPQAWWAWVLIAVSVSSGILGVLFALAQHDLKRLLAYHSVENIGIIGLGLGLGVLGMALDMPALAVLALAGGLLHVVNHALFKGLLFLGAGAVAHATGTRDMEHLGGLVKRMPQTAILFAVGAVAICGLPPLNGFVSEFLIYVAAFLNVGKPGISVAAGVAVAGLAMIGTLAVACFSKAFGVVFLGEPRTSHGEKGHEVGGAMRLPMALLALGCAGVACFAPWILQGMKPLLSLVTGLPGDAIQAPLSLISRPMGLVVSGFFALVAFSALLAWIRHRLLAGRTVARGVTWDCGYLAPTARMQYTASSFAQPITEMFHAFLRTRKEETAPQGLFPAPGSLSTHTDDVFSKNLYEPAFRAVERALVRLHGMQQGRVQFYVLYIAATLFALLIWNLR